MADQGIKNVYLWQRNPSPHQLAFMRELFLSGARDHRLIVERLSSPERMRQGWVFELDDVCRNHTVVDPSREWIDRAIRSKNSLHIVSGIAAFETGKYVLKAVLQRGANVGIMSEAPDLRGARGTLRMMYGAAFERSVVRSLNPILAIGPQAFNWFRSLGAPAARVFEFCYTTSPARLELPVSTRTVSAGPLKVVFVGRLVRLKNLPLLIRALELCRGSLFKLAVVGDGPERGNVEAMVSGLNQADSVSFLGALPSADARRAMSEADVLVLPSLYDGWGAVVNEALQEGMYCLVSSACGAKALIHDERLGRIFEPTDPDQLARMLMETYERKLSGQMDRAYVRNWAKTHVSGKAVADYFSRIVGYAYSGGVAERPLPPWCIGDNCSSRC